jgi:large subunit ribosomal protein L6
MRSLIAMVHGVKDGFGASSDRGIGYRAQLQGKSLQLALGYSHPVVFPLPEGIQAEVDRQVSITIKGADKALVGQTAAKIRELRKPDPYKGKGTSTPMSTSAARSARRREPSNATDLVTRSHCGAHEG